MSFWIVVYTTLGFANLGIAAAMWVAGDYSEMLTRLNIAGLFGLVTVLLLVIGDLKRERDKS